jgi:spoIIIJ-associated protein
MNMVAQEREIQSSGSDIEEAIAKGLEELGVSRSEVDVEILDSGSSGFLGIGGREASVKITLSSETPISPDLKDAKESEDIAAEAQEGMVVTAPEEETLSEAEIEPVDERKEEEIAKEVVDNLLEKLHFEAATSLHETEPDDITGETRWVIDVSGEDLGMLIGTRGETLNALQHVARLMTGHAMRQRPTFILDVEGYRTRREQALARLADRMASKVVKRGQPMTLEPMPPNERRIIHITLRDDERVYTESIGEGRQRKVRIFPSD